MQYHSINYEDTGLLILDYILLYIYAVNIDFGRARICIKSFK